MTPTQFFSQTQLNLLHANSENPAGPLPVVKIFTPFHNCTWLLTELEPETNDTAFGLCDLGFGTPELGYVSMHGILSLKIPVEQDLYCVLDQPLFYFTKKAKIHGYINTQ